MAHHSSKGLTFVNAFRGSGIGDFGWKLKSEFEKKVSVKYLEIIPTWRGLITLWKNLIRCNSQVVFNLGFTSFGNSVYRNFINFLLLKAFSIVHPRQSLILHDSIDTSNLENSGYSNSWLLPIGGSIAIKMLNDYNVFVFSRNFKGILKKKYKLKRVFYFPFPTENGTSLECYRPSLNPLLLNVGYIAPYKGLEILPEIKARLNGIDTMIVGSFYKNLLSTKSGQLYKTKLENVMRNSGVTLSGHLDDGNLIEVVKKHRTIAILPYVSGYNASYSAIMFVTLGIPVVASNLSIFQESQENGAGIIIVDRTPEAFANAVTTILNSPDLTRDLIEGDKKYCAHYSIHNFCDFLIDESKMVTS